MNRARKSFGIVLFNGLPIEPAPNGVIGAIIGKSKLRHSSISSYTVPAHLVFEIESITCKAAVRFRELQGWNEAGRGHIALAKAERRGAAHRVR